MSAAFLVAPYDMVLKKMELVRSLRKYQRQRFYMNIVEDYVGAIRTIQVSKAKTLKHLKRATEKQVGEGEEGTGREVFCVYLVFIPSQEFTLGFYVQPRFLRTFLLNCLSSNLLKHDLLPLSSCVELLRNFLAGDLKLLRDALAKSRLHVFGDEEVSQQVLQILYKIHFKADAQRWDVFEKLDPYAKVIAGAISNLELRIIPPSNVTLADMINDIPAFDAFCLKAPRRLVKVISCPGSDRELFFVAGRGLSFCSFYDFINGASPINLDFEHVQHFDLAGNRFLVAFTFDCRLQVYDLLEDRPGKKVGDLLAQFDFPHGKVCSCSDDCCVSGFSTSKHLSDLVLLEGPEWCVMMDVSSILGTARNAKPYQVRFKLLRAPAAESAPSKPPELLLDPIHVRSECGQYSLKLFNLTLPDQTDFTGARLQVDPLESCDSVSAFSAFLMVFYRTGIFAIDLAAGTYSVDASLKRQKITAIWFDRCIDSTLLLTSSALSYECRLYQKRPVLLKLGLPPSTDNLLALAVGGDSLDRYYSIHTEIVRPPSSASRGVDCGDIQNQLVLSVRKRQKVRPIFTSEEQFRGLAIKVFGEKQYVLLFNKYKSTNLVLIPLISDFKL